MEKAAMTPVISLEKDCIMVKLTKDVLEHCQKFTCGEEDLDDFFANDAIAYAKDLMGKTYCWLLKNDDTKIVAMVTLANAGIQTTHLPNSPKRKLNKHIAYNKRGRTYPAVLIGRLGVATDYQGKDYMIGAQLMNFVKPWFSGEDNKTGCRFILVDAVNKERTIKYYERNGFIPLFPRIEDEKIFYDIPMEEDLRTRMFFHDLID